MNNEFFIKSPLKRQNRLKKSIYGFALRHWSYCRLILEVFIRKNFGLQYFSIGVCIWVTILLCVMPSFFHLVSAGYHSLTSIFGSSYYRATPENFYIDYISWYLFSALFLVFSFIRYYEVKRNGFNPNFSKLATYGGDFNPIFFNLPFIGYKSVRTVETKLEPGVFLLLGILLRFYGQPVGLLLIISSVMYSLSHAAQYADGDAKLYEMNDQGVINLEVNKRLNEEYFKKGTEGNNVHMERPDSQNTNIDNGSSDKPDNEEKPHIFKA